MTTRYLITYGNGRPAQVETSLRAARALVGPYLAHGEPGTWYGYATARAARADAGEGTGATGVVTRIDDARAFARDGIDADGTEYGQAIRELVRQSVE